MFLLTVGFAAAQARSPVPRPQATATVEIRAYDTFGNVISPVVKIFSQGEPRSLNLASRFTGGIGRDIPWGTYRVFVQLTGYFSEEREVHVYGHDVLVTAGLIPGFEIPNSPPEKRGRVLAEPNSLSRDAFVKLVSVFGISSLEAAIKPDGTFVFSGVTPGKYLLLVISAGSVAGTKALTIGFSDESPIQIEVTRPGAPPR